MNLVKRCTKKNVKEVAINIHSNNTSSMPKDKKNKYDDKVLKKSDLNELIARIENLEKKFSNNKNTLPPTGKKTPNKNIYEHITSIP